MNPSALIVEPKRKQTEEWPGWSPAGHISLPSQPTQNCLYHCTTTVLLYCNNIVLYSTYQQDAWYSGLKLQTLKKYFSIFIFLFLFETCCVYILHEDCNFSSKYCKNKHLTGIMTMKKMVQPLLYCVLCYCTRSDIFACSDHVL